MRLSLKSYNWHLWQLSNITHPLPRKRNIWQMIYKCVWKVSLKQWKQGNTWFSKTRKRPLEIAVFFYGNNCKVDKFTLIKTSPTHTNRLCHIFPFRGRGWVILLNCHIYQLYLLRINCIKKHPNSFESGYLVIRNYCVRSFWCV